VCRQQQKRLDLSSPAKPPISRVRDSEGMVVCTFTHEPKIIHLFPHRVGPLFVVFPPGAGARDIGLAPEPFEPLQLLRLRVAAAAPVEGAASTPTAAAAA
jgi:hypothetical protein